MTFFGRSNELAALNQMYDENTFQMMVVYGRRRIGKTSILNEFVKDKPHLYLAAEEVNDELNLKMFSEQLGRKMGVANFQQWIVGIIFLRLSLNNLDKNTW